MPSNIEIKATAANWTCQLETAARLGTFQERLHQRDTFFRVSDGRLKLRQERRVGSGGESSRLIFYRRADTSAPTRSMYRSLEVPDTHGMREVLAGALKVMVTVEKTRDLYLAGRTRIHFDRVCRLGCFIELEHPLKDHEDQSAGRRVVENLMKSLEIAPGDLVSEAYADLLMDEQTSCTLDGGYGVRVRKHP